MLNVSYSFFTISEIFMALEKHDKEIQVNNAKLTDSIPFY